MDKIRIESAFFDLFFTVYDPKVRKIFCLGKNDPEYNKIQKEFVKEIKSAIRKYKNQAKKYLIKKGEKNVNL